MKQRVFVGVMVVMGIVMLGLLILCIYFGSEMHARVYSSNIGDSLVIDVNDEGNYLKNIVYPSNLIMGTNHKQSITINKFGTSGMYLRAKVTCSDVVKNKIIPITIVTSDDWKKVGDYYYYSATNTIEPEIEFMSSFTVPVIDQSIKYNAVINVLVECVSADTNVGVFWNLDNMDSSIVLGIA